MIAIILSAVVVALAVAGLIANSTVGIIMEQERNGMKVPFGRFLSWVAPAMVGGFILSIVLAYVIHQLI